MLKKNHGRGFPLLPVVRLPATHCHRVGIPLPWQNACLGLVGGHPVACLPPAWLIASTWRKIVHRAALRCHAPSPRTMFTSARWRGAFMAITSSHACSRRHVAAPRDMPSRHASRHVPRRMLPLVNVVRLSASPRRVYAPRRFSSRPPGSYMLPSSQAQPLATGKCHVAGGSGGSGPPVTCHGAEEGVRWQREAGHALLVHACRRRRTHAFAASSAVVATVAAFQTLPARAVQRRVRLLPGSSGTLEH